MTDGVDVNMQVEQKDLCSHHSDGTVKRQTAVTAYFSSWQLLLYIFPSDTRRCCNVELKSLTLIQRRSNVDRVFGGLIADCYVVMIWMYAKLRSVYKSDHFQPYMRHVVIFSKHNTLIRCSANVGPAWQAVSQH